MEPKGFLRIPIPVGIREVVKADSKALGIPGYLLYEKIIENFIYKSAAERKRIYLGRRKRGVRKPADESES